MSNNLLVFATKKVGTELTRYLINRKEPIRDLIIADDSDHALIELARENELNWTTYHDNIQKKLSNRDREYSWILNLWSPHILKKKLLQNAHHTLNAHPGYVPDLRGSCSATWSIRKDIPAGVSLITINEEIDTGDIYAREKIQYELPIRGKQLQERLKRQLIQSFKENWPQIENGNIEPFPQEDSSNYFTRKETRKDRVKQSLSEMSDIEIVRWICAHDFYPDTCARIKYNSKEIPLTTPI